MSTWLHVDSNRYGVEKASRRIRPARWVSFTAGQAPQPCLRYAHFDRTMHFLSAMASGRFVVPRLCARKKLGRTPTELDQQLSACDNTVLA